MTWDQETVKELTDLIGSASYSRLGKRWGVSGSAVSGAVRRHVYGIKDDKRKAVGSRRGDNDWERRLTESWEQRKRRKAKERENGNETQSGQV